MNSYLVNFATYTFAMIGFILIVLIVYKKTMYSPSDKVNKNFLKIENTLRLSPTKTVYVIKAGTERFLVAGDAANTTMLAKLDENNICVPEIVEEQNVVPSYPLKDILQKLNRG